MMGEYAGMLNRLRFRAQPRAAVWGLGGPAASDVHGGYLRQHGEVAWLASAAAASLTFPEKTRIPRQRSSKAKI